jgi:hypothetical protein
MVHTLTETVLETTVNSFEVTHAACASSATAFALGAPVIYKYSYNMLIINS